MVKIKLYSGCILTICVIVAGFLCACEGGDAGKQELIELEQKVQAESVDFNLLLDDLATHIASIGDPCETDVAELFPDDWLFEITESGSTGKSSFAVAVPVPKDIIRGLTHKKMTNELVTLDRGGRMDPNTNLYIADVWTGQPYDWGMIMGVDDEIRKYPILVEMDFFKKYKLIAQPYMVPPEATYGVYSGDWSVKNCAAGKLKNTVDELKTNNPYTLSLESQISDNSTYLDALKQLRSDIAKVEHDAKSYLEFVTLMNNNFFSKSVYEYSKGDELGNYIKQMTDIEEEVEKVREYLSKLGDWDFSNLNRYNELMNQNKEE